MLVVPSASDADAVIWADCPLAMSSAIVLASPSESVGVETSNSSWSVMAMLNVSVVVVESSAWLPFQQQAVRQQELASA